MHHVSYDLPISVGSLDSFRYLSHHGIKGQKWGIRRFQNQDGTRTALGKKRYTWLQDVLGYDERDSVREAAANMQRSSQGILKAQRKLDQSRQASKNAEKRGDKATSVLENWNNTPYHSYPANYSGTQYNTSADMVRAWQEAQADEYAEWQSKQLESYEDMDLLEKAIARYNTDRNLVDMTMSDYRKTPLGVVDSAMTTVSKGATRVKQLIAKLKVAVKGSTVTGRRRIRRG